MSENKGASAHTKKLQVEFLEANYLDINDKRDFEDAKRGLVEKFTEPVKGVGVDIWNSDLYSFLAEDKPASDTVNPSLWRQAVLNTNQGLYKVIDGIYQVRGIDVANITFIEGKTGWIVLDTLTNTNASAAALVLFFKHFEKKPITGVIYTHSHVDHWGGSRGVISQEEAAERSVPIIAPDRFMEKAVSENVLAGNAMHRRGSYMFGIYIERSSQGNVDAGLGKSFGHGTLSLVPPNLIIKEPYETHIIDGVELIFQLTPETEAPAEMTVFLPGYRAFCPAELCNQTMHNIYTIRGAETRDSKAWAGYINEAIHKFGGQFDVVFTTHNWPVWGRGNALDYLKKQRDIYKFIHDQTLRLANSGYTINEISDKIKLPKSLSETWSVRGNYGTVSHNAKAVYNRYLGYYDGNPATLNELPTEESAKKYLEYMGGAKAVINRVRKDFERGEYRFAAQVLRHVVFAEPDNKEAKELLADVFEQLGYASESAPWRNAYLSGSNELRNGVTSAAVAGDVAVLSSLSVGDLFDLMAVRLNSQRAEGKKATYNFLLTDIDERYALYLENSVLNHQKGKNEESADVYLKISKKNLIAVFAKLTTPKELLLSGGAEISGNAPALAELFDLLDAPDPSFNIILP